MGLVPAALIEKYPLVVSSTEGAMVGKYFFGNFLRSLEFNEGLLCLVFILPGANLGEVREEFFQDLRVVINGFV